MQPKIDFGDQKMQKKIRFQNGAKSLILEAKMGRIIQVHFILGELYLILSEVGGVRQALWQSQKST